MRLYCDLNTGKFALAPGTSQPLSSITVKRGPAAEIEIQFLRGITPQELEIDASGIFEVKTTDEFDSSPLTAALAWVKTGTGVDAIYTFTLPLVNDPLDALLGVDSLHAFTVVAGTDLFTSVAHGLTALTPIQFSSTVELPAPLLPNTTYYVSATGLTADDFKVSATSGGAVLDITDTGTGIHSFRRTANDIESVTLMAAMQWVADGRTNETQTIGFILENDVVREGEIPPAFPPLVYGVHLPEVLDMADFKSVPTVGMSLGYIVTVLIEVSSVFTWLTYRLEAGPTSETEPQHVEPNDYDLGTNDVHWNGAAGPSGPPGTHAGIAFKWNTNTAETDPGSGKVKVNDPDIFDATELYISQLDDDGNSIDDFIGTWDDGTSTIRGRFELRDPDNPANFVIYHITGARTDNGTWAKFSVTFIETEGTLTNNLPLRAFFTPKGDRGDSGDSGFKYLFNSATSGDPASGKFLFNHATFASATAFHISETDANANGLSALLAAIDGSSSTNKVLVLCSKLGGTGFFSFYITAALTDAGGYDTFPITPIATGGSIANGDTFFVSFTIIGDIGSIGAPGLHYQWNTNTASSDPTAGHLKVNNGTIASATALYISETDDDANGLAAVLATWDDSTATIKGKLFITSRASPAIFAIFNISGTITDNGAWDTFTIAHVASGGTLTNNMPVNLLFIPTGNDGGTTYDAAVAIGAGATPTVDLSAVSMSTLRLLAANTTVSLSNPVNGKVTILHFKQAAASSYTVDFPDVDFWLGTGGAQPTMSPGFDVVDAYTIWYDGTNIYATWAPGE